MLEYNLSGPYLDIWRELVVTLYIQVLLILQYVRLLLVYSSLACFSWVCPSNCHVDFLYTKTNKSISQQLCPETPLVSMMVQLYGNRSFISFSAVKAIGRHSLMLSCTRLPCEMMCT